MKYTDLNRNGRRFIAPIWGLSYWSGGGASGTLSALGVHAMYSGGWVLPITFALAAHSVIVMALRALPRTLALRRTLLLAAWFTAVNFAIAAAFYASYVNNLQDVVAETTDQVAQSFAVIREHVREKETAAVLADDKTQAEMLHGTFSAGLAGYGRKARELDREALTMEARAQEARVVGQIVDVALDSLRQPDMTLDMVRAIYRDTLTRVGSYAEGVPRISFNNDRCSFFAIVFGAYAVLTGYDRSVSRAERIRIFGSAGFASIMELLCLLGAVIRMEMLREPQDSRRRMKSAKVRRSSGRRS